jgi:predicted nucleic acid-binding protein
LYEVHKRLSRNLPPEIVASCLDVMRLGRVLELTDARAVAASTTASAHNLALADAAMYSMAQEHNATLWTQDIDYQGLSGVNYRAKRG